MTKVKRNFKDSLFRLVFHGKEELLSLYNAVNGSSYTNADDLEINTLEDVVYMGMKNDVSFLFAHYLNLYEAQSTSNQNMPLRGTIYFGDLIKKETGKSAQESIQLFVIEKAKERLYDENKTVSEVAYELGFKYPHHLSRLFKKVVGVTPNEYRA